MHCLPYIAANGNRLAGAGDEEFHELIVEMERRKQAAVISRSAPVLTEISIRRCIASFRNNMKLCKNYVVFQNAT